MLSKSLFTRLTISIFEDEMHYEALRVLGDPMVLFDGEDGHPIASIHLKRGSVSGAHVPLLITQANMHVFQALCAEDTKQDIFVVFTNLEYDKWIMCGVSTEEVAEHIPLRPGQSFPLVLTHNREFTFAICPTKAGIKYSSAKWKCPEIIVRTRVEMFDNPNIYNPPKQEELDLDCVSQLTKLKLCLPEGEDESLVKIQPPLHHDLLIKAAMTLIYETRIDNNRRLIESLGNKDFATDECAICMEDDSPPNVIIVKCGHRMYHDACLVKTGKKECPTCRGLIVGKINV